MKKVLLLLFFASSLLFSFETDTHPRVKQGNPLGIRGYDYVEWYVGCAKLFALWHVTSFGFEIKGSLRQKSDSMDRISYLLEKNNIRIVITSSLSPIDYEINNFVSLHGDGIKRFSYDVEDVSRCYNYATTHGAIPVKKPYKLKDDHGFINEASVKIYDDTEILLVNYDNYNGFFKPCYKINEESTHIGKTEIDLQSLDHITCNVRTNEMKKWADYLNEAFAFETYLDFGPGEIETKNSSLLSLVVRSNNGYIKHPIHESSKSTEISPIGKYIELYQGSGIQHIAMSTSNIIETAKLLKENGVEFVQIPASYYEHLKKKNLSTKEKIEDLQEYNIVCDLEGNGYLLQLYLKPIGDRETVFYEIIQRSRGAHGFAKSSLQTLIENLERERF